MSVLNENDVYVHKFITTITTPFNKSPGSKFKSFINLKYL